MSDQELPPSGEDAPVPSAGSEPTPPSGEGFSFFNTIPASPGATATGEVPSGNAPPGAPSSAPRRRRLLASRASGWVVAGVLAAAVVGLSVALATSSTGPVTAAQRPVARTAPGAGFPRAGGGFGATSRGVLGDITALRSGSFTISTSTGATDTVKETSSTTYRSFSFGSSPSGSGTASSLKKGDHVLVSGTTSGSTITATRVIVVPAGGFGGSGGAPAS